jgi:phenylpropionate dioxygenase-like ring-hydroxylating dioxygenase large terminal subunit
LVHFFKKEHSFFRCGVFRNDAGSGFGKIIVMNAEVGIERPVLIGTEAYVSPLYAQAEGVRLWNKIWQVACREEEITDVGDFVTYDILDESIIIVRATEQRIRAYHNQCRHRGRRLTEGCGNKKRLVCPFHAWSWTLEGRNAGVVRGDAWGDALKQEDIALKEVRVDSWGGFVFINMDPDCESLLDYLEPAATMLDPFELQNMRYRWRQWLQFPSNWKVAIEAFNEGYHVAGTHPQLTKFSTKPTWSDGRGRHGVFGAAAREGSGGATAGASGAADMRIGLKHSLNQLWEEVNATTTETMVRVANLLEDELPEGTPPNEVQLHLMRRTIEEDAKRGVMWPRIDPAHFAAAGNVWHLFPNTVIIHGPTFALCYRARPDGYDPDRCIFEVYTLEKFPPGQEPKPENLYRPELTEANWRRVLCQDFSNMGAVQKGLKSRHFEGIRPSPVEEKAIVNFHRVLAGYMGTGAPQPLY